MAWISVLRSTGSPVLATALGLFCATGSLVHAQTDATPAPGANAQPAAKPSGSSANPTHAVKHKIRGHTAKVEAEPEPVVPAHPPDPPPPDWPVNDKAKPASVGWNGRDLSIAATNSSLDQILHDVSTAVGVKVEGMGSDQRIYGSYGPAAARDVLSQLLDGSGYNVLMIGDQGQGTPRELVLTAKAGHDASQVQNAQPKQSTEEDVPDEPEPPAPEQPDPNMHRPFTPPQQPGQVRTPQQIMQQQQQQQQQQPQQPPQGVPVPPPNN
jgi:hypothetical protein